MSMDERTLAALHGSIAKWAAIVAGTGEDNGPENCPLCQLFHSEYRTDLGRCCTGCPVYTAGYAGCSNDEYTDFCDIEAQRDEGEYVAPEMHEAATRELDFLKSLLPGAPS